MTNTQFSHAHTMVVRLASLAAFATASTNVNTIGVADKADHFFECSNGTRFNILDNHSWNACSESGHHITKCPKLYPVVCAYQAGGPLACAQIKEDCVNGKTLKDTNNVEQKGIMTASGEKKCHVLPSKCEPESPGKPIINSYLCVPEDAPASENGGSELYNERKCWTECEENKEKVAQCPEFFPIVCEDQAPGHVKCAQHALQCHDRKVEHKATCETEVLQAVYDDLNSATDLVKTCTEEPSVDSQCKFTKNNGDCCVNGLSEDGEECVCVAQDGVECVPKCADLKENGHNEADKFSCNCDDNSWDAQLENIAGYFNDDELKQRFLAERWQNPASTRRQCLEVYRRIPLICDSSYSNCERHKQTDGEVIPMRLMEWEASVEGQQVSQSEVTAENGCTMLLNAYISREKVILEEALVTEKGKSGLIQLVHCGFPTLQGDGSNTENHVTIDGGKLTRQMSLETNVGNYKNNNPDPDQQDVVPILEFARLPFDDNGNCKLPLVEECDAAADYRLEFLRAQKVEQEKQANFDKAQFKAEWTRNNPMPYQAFIEENLLPFRPANNPENQGRNLALTNSAGNGEVLSSSSPPAGKIQPYAMFFVAVPVAASLLWLWILLGVLGLLALLLLAACLAHRRKQRKAPVVFQEDQDHGIQVGDNNMYDERPNRLE